MNRPRNISRGMPRRAVTIACALAIVCSWTSATGAQAMKSVEPGDHGRTVKSLQRALGLTADGIYGEGTERVVKRFQRRHQLDADGRRPVDLADAAPHRSCRPPRRAHRTARLVRARAAAQARDRRRRRLRARHIARRARIPAVPRPDRGRCRRPRDMVGARHQRHPARPQAPAPSPRRPSSEWPAAADPPRDRRRQRDRRQALPLRRRARQLRRQRLRLLGQRLLRAPCGGRARQPAGLRAADELGQPGPGRWITVYAHGSHAFMVVNGRRFDTSGASQSGSRWQRSERSTAGYVVRHPPGL